MVNLPSSSQQQVSMLKTWGNQWSTQTGSGNSILIEDDTNPDATPFIVDNLGSVGIGLSSVVGINAKLVVVGNISSNAVVYASGGNLS